MSHIEVNNVCKSYGSPGQEPRDVLNDISFRIGKGEFITVFGPNGCGKSTLLNVIAGLTDCQKGSVFVGGKPPQDSRIGFVFQDYRQSLFPWLLNIDNVGFALDTINGNRKERHAYIEDFAKKIGLNGLPLYQYPYQCSSGQQQLVALLRELIYDPHVLLMDEPFASLDYERRISLQENLLRIWQETGVTIIFVSHEIDEAIYLADRVILFTKRPARVAATFEVGLPRPRTPEMLERQEFFNVKLPILRAFREVISV